MVRDPERAPRPPGAEIAQASYNDAAAMRSALSGVQTLFLVSAKEAFRRVQEHATAVDAALAAGVERIVYLSFLAAAPDATFTFARDHFHTEEHVRSTGGLDPLWWTPESLEAKPPRRESTCRTSQGCVIQRSSRPRLSD